MSVNQWFKLYGGEYLSDPKIASLTPQERSCWITLLCLSSISSTPGRIEFLTVESLLQKSGIVWDPYTPDEWDKALSVLEKFVRMRMITKDENGFIEVLNWKKRQETALTNAERQAKYRERNEKVTDNVTKVTLDKIREDKNTSEAKTSHGLPIIEEKDTNEEKPLRRDTDYLEVFSLWGAKYPLNWKKNRTEIDAAKNLLNEKGITAIKQALKFAKDHEKDPYCPKISKPSDLDRKWANLKQYVSA